MISSPLPRGVNLFTSIAPNCGTSVVYPLPLDLSYVNRLDRLVGLIVISFDIEIIIVRQCVRGSSISVYVPVRGRFPLVRQPS